MVRKRASSARKLGNGNFLGEDGFVYNIWVGDQTSETVQSSYKELEKVCGQLKKQGQPIIVLADITKLGKVTAGARREGYKLMKYSDYDWAAVYGNYFLFRGLVESLIVATGMGFKIKFFHNKEKALEWLNEKLQISETSSPW